MYVAIQLSIFFLICFEGSEALSRFGREFFLSLERSLIACGEQRDKAASEMETLQTELDRALETLQNLKEQKVKRAGPRQHFPKPKDGRTQGTEASNFNVLSEKKSEPPSVCKFSLQKESLMSKSPPAVEKHLINLSSKQKVESSDGIAIQQQRKLLPRSKSMKVTERPPWQD